ncbi:MAG: bacteriorhodopsin [Spirochaetales bacterium]
MASAAIVGMVLFALSSVYFSLSWRHEFNTAVLVNVVTLLSYLLLLEGSFVSLSPDGQPQFFPRWILYGLSHSLIAYQMTRLLGKTPDERTFLLFLSATTMGTFALASHFHGEWMTVFFAIATVLQLGFVRRTLKTVAEYRGVVANYLWLAWSAFPVVFLISPEGIAAVSTAVAAWLFLLSDLVTKIVFYVDVSLRLRHHPEPGTHQARAHR